MPPTTIKQFRELLRGALEEDGFVAKRIESKMPLAWALPGHEITPYFLPHEMRRPWGFRLSGTIAVELTALRDWLDARVPRHEQGIFRHFFVIYHIANDKLLSDLSATFDEDVPFDDWVARVKHRLIEVPDTLDGLIGIYRRAPHHLGWLSSPINKPAWDFLLRWHQDRKAVLAVPQSLF